MIDKSEDLKIMRQILSLQDKKISELKALWERMFDHPPAISSREYMIAKIAYRIQELAYGGVDEATRDKIQAAAREIKRPKAIGSKKFRPMIGTKIMKEYKGNVIEVLVVPDGFSYSGEIYKSLSSIATKITGTKWNGLKFFGVAGA
ncbi:MAG: DUF2924 domain-containing protein [Holosporaceae bacterium]|jgi:hypothetical protein|nr:DUF2924 domain-containing protein [Holosporaceae bacterium]